jgi:hypothetical protein
MLSKMAWYRMGLGMIIATVMQRVIWQKAVNNAYLFNIAIKLRGWS